MSLNHRVKELTKGIEEWMVRRSLEVIEKAFESFDRIGVAWSTGKDSTVNLFLARQFDKKIPVLFGDTTQHYQETYEHRDRVAQDWDLNLVNMVPDLSYEEVKGERERCCHALKTQPALKTVEQLGLEAVIVGVRWSEHPVRAKEEYFSKREGEQIFSHYRIHPLLHWTEEDIWDFTKAHNLPHNPLYDKGFRSIGCAPCTKPAPPDAPERSGRAQDKEKIMKRLRALGYW